MLKNSYAMSNTITQSDESSATYPSTSKQKDFGMYLVKELHGLGICDAAMDDNGYVSASISSNTDMDLPVIGFIAHMDTQPRFFGRRRKPKDGDRLRRQGQ